jgi:hypothetical protein
MKNPSKRQHDCNIIPLFQIQTKKCQAKNYYSGIRGRGNDWQICKQVTGSDHQMVHKCQKHISNSIMSENIRQVPVRLKFQSLCNF